jgi:NhaA family Na+:H+ antiporter
VAAVILLPTTLLALIFAPHLTVINSEASLFGIAHTWRDWAALGPLAIFFFVAGLELKAEFTSGLFMNKRRALIPLGAVTGGMLTPALLYILFARITGAPPSAWGIPMATDLPLVLAALSFAPIPFIAKVRPFLLALAITDDLGSIIVLALRFHQEFSFLYLGLLLLMLTLYWVGVRHLHGSIQVFVMAAAALIIWICSLRSGISPTFIAVILALLTPTVSAKVREERWEPAVNFVIVPLFIFTALAISITFNVESIFSPISLSLIFARLIGKPVGIFIGALIASYISRTPVGLNRAELLGCGIIASLGLSISLLFAQLSLNVHDQALAIIGTLLTVPLAVAGIRAYYFFTRETAA